MKHKTTALPLIVLLVLVCGGLNFNPVHARTPNFVDQSDSFMSYSIGYEFTTGKFSEVENATDPDSTFSSSITKVQVSFRPTYYTQLYGIAGLEKYYLGGLDNDTETERGPVIGGGGQITLDTQKDLYLKATGSFYFHEKLESTASNDSLKFQQDWQGGVLLGRTVERPGIGNNTYYDSYMGVLFSRREVDIENGGDTTSYEMADFNGASLFAGVNWRYSRAVRIKFEGEYGAMTSAALRLTYTF